MDRLMEQFIHDQNANRYRALLWRVTDESQRKVLLEWHADEEVKLADTWQPLNQILDSDQKRRTAFVMIFVLREMGNGIEQRRLQTEEEDEAD